MPATAEWPKGHEQRLKPLDVCPGKVWQVGIGAVQVSNFSDADIATAIAKLWPGRGETEVLKEATTLAGYEPAADTYSKVVSSTGSLRKSWLLRHPTVGVWLVEKNVTQQCVNGATKWCYSDKWAQSKEFAATKEAALISIKDLETVFRDLAKSR
jgi:hypothetical protein